MLDPLERPTQTVNLETLKPHSRRQEIIMRAFLDPRLREVFVACGTKYGKAAELTCLVPTLDGVKALKDVHPGDFVFSEHGEPILVTEESPIMYGRPCYKIIFSDGTEIIVDEEHEWTTKTHTERKNIARAKSKNDRCKSTEAKATTRTTKEIFETRYHGKRANHSIDNITKPAHYQKKNLTICPYVLGVWLGDGTSRNGQITNPDDEVIEQIQKSGYTLTKNKGKYLWNIVGLHKDLKELGLILNKHVPDDYLYSSTKDRLNLLQGLMDTDGTVDKRGNCCFDNTNKNLADSVQFLSQSLGIKALRDQRYGKIDGVSKKLCYRVNFTTDIPVFTVKRKLERLRKINQKSRQRVITKIEPCESVPVKCITVDNPTHLFCITEAFIPTHNSISASTALTNGIIHKRGGTFRWIAPIYRQAKIGMDYFSGIAPPPPYSEIVESKMMMRFPDLNSRIEFWHTTRPVDLEGAAVQGQVGDEAAKMPYDAYVSANTTTTFTKALSMWISTPYGKNWFYKKYMEAKEHMEWSIANGKMPIKIAIHAPTSANPLVDPAIIEQARLNLPDRLFRQYYLAEFLDDGSVFINFRKCVRGTELNFDGPTQYWFDDGYEKLENIVIGVDWAKHKDFTVFIAIDPMSNPRRVVGFMRFQGLSYTVAIKEMWQFAKKFEGVGLIYHDKTGVGDAIDDMLAPLPLPFKGLSFSNPMKSNLVNSLGMGFEKESIELPNWPEMLKELDAFEVVINKLGTTIYNAPEGMHDDIVMALGLANLAANEYAGEFEIQYLEDLPSKIITLDDYYNDMIDDEDDY